MVSIFQFLKLLNQMEEQLSLSDGNENFLSDGRTTFFVRWKHKLLSQMEEQPSLSDGHTNFLV